jgi:predicted RecB family nuclease
MTVFLTAAMLYDLVGCPHRVTMDLFTDPAQRDKPNAFVGLLWERGSLYEREVIAGLQTPFTDLSSHATEERARLTLEAIQRGDSLIYGGRISADGLLGDPDLLRYEGTGYVAGDIKSGAGEEGREDDSKPKIRYAVQIGLYTDILERMGLSGGRRGFVWDIHGHEVPLRFSETIREARPENTVGQLSGCGC